MSIFDAAMIRRALPDLSRLDPLFKDGPVSHLIAATLFTMMVIGAIGSLRTGRWWWRVLLIGAALIWPLPDNPLQGPILRQLTYSHGMHWGDLITIVALIIAVLPVKPGRARSKQVQRR